MKLGHIGGVNPYNIYHKPIGTNKKSSASDKNTFATQLDTYIASQSLANAANPTMANKLWGDTNHAADSIRKLVESAVGRSNASGQGFWAVRANDVRLSSADRAHAQSLINEDGFFGVKQTTDRLIGFAKSLIGDNVSGGQIEKMRAAVQTGFNQVARMFGGFDRLPDVSKQTHDAVMMAFDNWKSAAA